MSSVDNSLVFEESNQLSARTEIVDKLFASDFLCRISSGGQMVMRSTERGGAGERRELRTTNWDPETETKKMRRQRKLLKAQWRGGCSLKIRNMKR